MEESQSKANGHSVNSAKSSALERLRKSLEASSTLHKTIQGANVQSFVESNLSSAGTSSETRNLWLLVKRLAEKKGPSSSTEEDEEENDEKPASTAPQRFHSIPSIVERLKSSNLANTIITDNLSEEEKQVEQKKRLAMKWKMAVRTASTKSHIASPSLLGDIKKLESELDEFKDELRQHHQISLAFAPPQYQRNIVVREMDEGEFNLALQKDKNRANCWTPSTSVRNSTDMRTSVEYSQTKSPRPMSGKQASHETSFSPRPERPKSANNPRGYGSRWFLPVEAWSSFENPQQPQSMQDEEFQIGLKRMDNIDVLHSSKTFKQFLLENDQRVPHFLDTVPIPSTKPNATLPSTTHVPSKSKSNSTSPQMTRRRRKSISGPTTNTSSRPSTTSSFGSTSSLRTASSPVPKRLTWSSSTTKKPSITKANQSK